MARYIPTHDGQHVVDVSDAEMPSTVRVISISVAEILLQDWRRYAWEQASNGSGYVANFLNSWSNSLSDALTFAAELRAEAEKRRAAA